MAGKQAVYEVFTRFRIDARGWDKSINRLSRSLVRAGKQMDRVGQNLTRNVTAPLALAGGAAVKFAVDLEGSFAKIQNLVGISADQLSDFASQVRRISETTGEAQKSLADALFVVTSAGARGAEAIQILEQASKASAAGLGETSAIARTVTAVLQSYGKENITAARATDILFATVREGNLEAETLSEALGPLLGLAAKLGVSFEEVGANIATFTRLGVSAEQAATSLQAIFTTFLKPTEGASKALAEFGLSAKDLRDRIASDGLADTLIFLTETIGDNDDKLAEIIPNVRALRGVLGTAGVQAASYSDILRSIATNTDLVDQGFENVSKTAGAQFKQTLTSLQNVAIELGNVLLPILTDVAAKIRDLISAFANLPAGTKKTIVQIGLVAAAIGPLLIIVGKVVVAIGTLVKIFRAASLAFGIVALKVLAVVAAVAALIAVGVALYRNWDNVKQFFVNVWDRIKLAFFKSIEQIKVLWAGFLAFLGLDNSGVLQSIIEGKEEIENLQKAVSDQLPLSIQGLQLLGTTFEELKGVIGGAKDAVSGFFGSFGGGGIGGGTDTPIVAAAGETRTDGLQGLPEISRGGGIDGTQAFQNILIKLKEDLPVVNQAIASMNAGFQQQAEKGQVAAEIIGGVLSDAFSGLGNAMIASFESGQNALQAFGRFFVDFAKNLIAKMLSLIATALILSAILSTIGFGVGAGGAVTKGIGFAKSLGNILKGGLPSLAIGTNYVNRDGLAYLHKGEQVVPANVQGGGFGGGGNLVAKVQGGDLWFIYEEQKRKRNNTG